MKVVLIADTHFGIRNDASVFYDYFEQSLKDFFLYIDTFNIKHVIHLGDLFDRRKYLNFRTAKFAREKFLEPLSERGIETHILTGNHDHYYKDTHAVNSLDEIVGTRYPNIHIYSKPKKITIDDTNIMLMPWITSSNMEEAKYAVQAKDCPVLLGHLELLGFERNKGNVSDHGDGADLYRNFVLVASGHYHHRSSRDNINYIGAFAEFYWSDFADPRGFSVLDTKDLSLEFHRNKNTMFNMYLYDDVNDEDLAYVRLSPEKFKHFANTFVKIVVSKKNNPYAFDVLFDTIEKVGPVSISVVEGETLLQDLSDDADILESVEDTSTLLNKYIDSLTLPVDSDKLKKLMSGLYQEALTIESME